MNDDFGGWLAYLSQDPSLRGSIDLSPRIAQFIDTENLCNRIYTQALLERAAIDINIFRNRTIFTYRMKKSLSLIQQCYNGFRVRYEHTTPLIV